MNALVKNYNDVELQNEFNFNEFENRFFEMLNVKETTYNTYKVSLKSFFAWLSDENITSPKALDIVNYKRYLVNNVKSSTVNLYLSAIKQFFSFLEVHGLYKNIAREVKGEKFSKYGKKDALTVEQIQELLNTCDDTVKGLRDKAIISLMASCGLRDIEVARLCKNDIVLIDGVFYIYIQGKGRSDKDERMALPLEVYQAIQRYLKVKRCKGSTYVFSSESNNCKGGMTVQAISGVVKTALRAIGLDSERLTAHSLRTSAVTNLLKQGVNVLEVQAFARHANINTTMIYNRMVQSDSVKVRCSNLLFNGLTI